MQSFCKELSLKNFTKQCKNIYNKQNSELFNYEFKQNINNNKESILDNINNNNFEQALNIEILNKECDSIINNILEKNNNGNKICINQDISIKNSQYYKSYKK